VAKKFLGEKLSWRLDALKALSESCTLLFHKFPFNVEGREAIHCGFKRYGTKTNF
jgi:hypothetical protein